MNVQSFPKWPEWGSMPLEQWILARWTTTLPDSSDSERRTALIHAFTREGAQAREPFLKAILLPMEPADVSMASWPPQAEWQAILAPIRSQKLRDFASVHGEAHQNMHEAPFGIVWLRTCYDKSREAKYEQLLSDLDADMALEDECNVLDDPNTFNFGDDWQRIFGVIPEALLDPRQEPLKITVEDEEEFRGLSQQALSPIPRSHDMLEFKAAMAKFHGHFVVNYILVADSTAMDTGEMLIVFFDDRGQCVRHMRRAPVYATSLAGGWCEVFVHELAGFSRGDIGDAYRPGGPCGPPFE